MAGFSNSFAFVMTTTIYSSLVAEISDGIVAAAGPLHGEQIKWRDESFLRIQSPQRGPVPPSQPSPCGHTLGGIGHCPLTEMNYAGGHKVFILARNRISISVMAGLTSFVMATTIALVLLADAFHGVAAARTFRWDDERFLKIESLQRGPVPPSRASGCGHTPRPGETGRCPLDEMNYSGGGRFRSRRAPSPPLPDHAVAPSPAKSSNGGDFSA
ncbi:unnamed protein product [Linum tenue]|uniref:CASP-like protein n=1 Tax=Linum tenue TaxID=586396 RepID=A0AAV0RRP7_9ROSI|nr:unnamed protein product [Linum tenue]